MTTHAVVLAAGKGTRMKSDLAKVLHLAAGRPLVSWMLDVLAPLPIDHTVVVVGHQADRVRAVLPESVDTALQEEQNGTGHAVMVALESFEPAADDTVLVIPGDMPLIESASLQRLFDVHRAEAAAASILTVVIDDPPPYGRVLRNEAGHVVEVVEARDATPEQLAVTELNTSVYLFDAGRLRAALTELTPDNDQGELYLTDVVGILTARGETVAAVAAAAADEGQGVNTVAELDSVGARLATRNRPI
ncbi:MAG: NTP transferase domain-containing protein [Acidimicrobiia bacterium]|nr:NTP transferase domain-containing protein [Acidimicrobiia bacterium]